MKSNFKPVRKTFARLLVIQSLYGQKITSDDDLDIKVFAEKLLNQFKNENFIEEVGLHRAPSIDKAFLKSLLDIIENNKDEIDQVISENLAENWTIDKLDNVLLGILKAGIAEILYCAEIPTRVIIDEYVTITSGFFEKNEVGFVNGILDKIAKAKRV